MSTLRTQLGFSFLLAATGCTALIGVSDLPPATDSGADGAPVDSGLRPDAKDASPHDATRADATADASDAGQADATTDATHPSDARDAGLDAATDAVDAPPPIFQVEPAALAFGDAGGKLGFVTCGGSAIPTRTLTLTNNTGASYAWSASLGLGGASPFKLSMDCTPASPCTLMPGAANATTITVTGPLAPSDAGLVTFTDTLTLYPAVTPPTTVKLVESAYGAILAFSQTDVNFGLEPENQPDGGYPQMVQLENNGNGPFEGTLRLHLPFIGPDGGTVDAGSAVPTEFAITEVAGDSGTVDATTTIGVASGKETPFRVSFEPHGSAADAAAALVVSGSPPGLCAPLPSPVTLEGRGTLSPISTTSSLNFNTGPSGNNGAGVSCGTTGVAQTITVTNTATQAAPLPMITGLTLAAGASSPFSVPATPIVIPQGTQAAPSMTPILVTPSAIPSTATPGEIFNDTLLITTNLVGDLPHAVQLQMTAAGVVLVPVTPTTIVMNSVLVDGASSYQPFVANIGNVQTGGFDTTASSPSLNLNGPSLSAFETQSFDLQYRATAQGSFTASATATLRAGVPFCNPPATPFNGSISYNVSGVIIGNAPGVSLQDGVSRSQLQVDADCAPLGVAGTPMSLPFTLSVKDAKTVHWSAALTGPGASFFGLSATEGNLPGPGSLGLDINVLGVSSTSGLTAAEALGGLGAQVAVTFTGGTNGTEVYAFTVYEQLKGAFLQWSTPSVNVFPYGMTDFSLQDLNVSGTAVTVASGSTALPLSTLSGAPRAQNPFTLGISDNHAAPNATTTVTASVGSTMPVCAPIPTPLPVMLVP